MGPMQHAPSRFLKAAAVSRFLVRHPKLSRFIAAHVPAASRFLPLPAVEDTNAMALAMVLAR